MKIFGFEEEKQVEYVLFGIVLLLMIVVSLFLVFGIGGSKAKIEAPAGYKIVYPKDAPSRLEKIF